MHSNWDIYLFLTLFCVFFQGFFAMFEMAAVSFNKVRLQYYVSQNIKRAKWLKFLLDNPSRLFGTTLITVNTVIQLGSECSRRFYEAIGFSPDLAPITQIIIVLIFGELAPMFAARKHAENCAFLAVPLSYFISKILTPFIWVIGKISKFANFIFGAQKKQEIFLSKQEIQMAFEERSKHSLEVKEQSIDTIVSKIFNLKNLKANHLKIPLDIVKSISTQTKIKDLKKFSNFFKFSYVLVYHNTKENIVGICHIRDLLKAENFQNILDFSKPPWFVTETISVMDLLEQFKYNNQDLAVVINKKGKATGIITLDQIIDEIMPKHEKGLKEKDTQIVVKKKISTDMTLHEFNEKFESNLEYKDAETIDDLLKEVSGHIPSKDEVICYDHFEFTVLDISLTGIKTVLVKTLD